MWGQGPEPAELFTEWRRLQPYFPKSHGKPHDNQPAGEKGGPTIIAGI